MSIKSCAKSEFDFIESLKDRLPNSKIGDDCAVLPKDTRMDLVVTTDLLIEDIDFRRAWSTPELLGHKALAVSLSDVAAMGAKPVWSMLSIGIPAKIWKTDFVKRFYNGYLRLARKSSVELIGGDVSKTPDKIVIDSIAGGEVKKGKAVLRSGAKVGDLIFVTGNLGAAAGGLRLLQTGEKLEESKNKSLLLRQLAPHPQSEIGKIIGEYSLATAMIDLSDGLSSDLAHICLASKVGAKIFADKIPFDKKLNAIAGSFDEKINFALNGGEDFELLLTVNPKKVFRLKKELGNQKIFRLGEVTVNANIIKLITGAKTRILPPKGFRHF